jgi:hypothetical protein
MPAQSQKGDADAQPGGLWGEHPIAFFRTRLHSVFVLLSARKMTTVVFGKANPSDFRRLLPPALPQNRSLDAGFDFLGGSNGCQPVGGGGGFDASASGILIEGAIRAAQNTITECDSTSGVARPKWSQSQALHVELMSRLAACLCFSSTFTSPGHEALKASRCHDQRS